jgi:hypothetical protein
MHGFGHGILQQPKRYEDENLAKLAEMYVGVVTDNIESFLKDKTKVVRFDVDKPRDSIHKIWEMGKIEGDVQKESGVCLNCNCVRFFFFSNSDLAARNILMRTNNTGSKVHKFVCVIADMGMARLQSAPDQYVKTKTATLPLKVRV